MATKKTKAKAKAAPQPKPEPKPMGRPVGATIYTEAKADLICERIAQGRSLVRICQDGDMPGYSTVMRWLTDNKTFRERYAQAREHQADFLADEIVDIADDSSGDLIQTENGPRLDTEFVQRSKLRVEARKWTASKLLPKKYGDKQFLEASHTHAFTELSDAELKKQIEDLLAQRGG